MMGSLFESLLLRLASAEGVRPKLNTGNRVAQVVDCPPSMAARILDGKALAAAVRASVKETVARLAARGVRPGLAVILAGDNPASAVYVRNKARACEETGVRSEVHRYGADVTERALLDRIAALNADPGVHGILVQLPLPGRINARRVLEAVAPAKDIDGFHFENLAAVGRPKLVTAAMVKPGACVIDVGINRLPDGTLAGDVDFDAVRNVAGWITPVPGGVGPMTITLLLENCVRAAAK